MEIDACPTAAPSHQLSHSWISPENWCLSRFAGSWPVRGLLSLKLRMQRGIHIAVTLIAVVAVIAPLDCFTNGVRTREAAVCCLKGNCHPRANADDCCKNTLPETSRLMPPTATNQHFPLVLMVVDTSTLGLAPVFHRLTNEFRHPPTTPSLATVNLPLLV